MRNNLMGLLLCLCLVLASCTSPDPYTKCKWYDATGNMQTLGFEIDTDVPDQCPIKIPSGTIMVQNYAGTVTGPASSVSAGNTLHVDIEDAYNEIVTSYLTTFSGGGPHTAFVNTTYFAGFAGRLPDAANQIDYAFNEVQIDEAAPGPNFGIGRVELPYSYTVQAIVGGPLSVPANTWVTATAQLLQSYPLPATYKWWINNILQSGNSSSLQYSQGSSGTVTFKVEVTDAEGDKGQATLTTTFTAPGGGGGGGGGGGEPGCAPGPDRAEQCPP